MNNVLKNASWIVGCKIIQAILALFINMMVARYLGPENFGTINYASSLVAFVTPFMQLGLNSILVLEFVQNPQIEGETLGTTLFLSGCSSLLCIIGVVSFASIVNSGDKEIVFVCLLYSLNLFLGAMELVQYWFQAKLLSKYTSIIFLCSYFIVAIYRIVLLINGKSIYWFAISNVIERAIISVFLLLQYKKLGGQKLCFSLERAKQLLVKSKYFIVSTLMITFFTQTDKVMLTLMMGENSTGIYSAAISCATLSSFVFSAIMDSARPSLLSCKKNDEKKYEELFVLLFSIIVYLSLIQGLVMTLFSKFIINILYGSLYKESAIILKIIIWYTPFSYIGAVRSIWILAENQQKYLWILNFCGATMNVIFNFLLIPFLGETGAAIATIITQFFTNIVLIYIIRPLRYSNHLMIQGLYPKYIIKYCNNIIKNIRRKQCK